MARRKIGVMLHSLGLGVKQGIRAAARLGLEGVELSVAGGELAPENLSQTGRRQLAKLVADHRLAISALCAELGTTFTDPARVEQLVEQTLPMVDLCLDVRAPGITTRIGTVPPGKSGEAWEAMLWSVVELGTYALNREVWLGIGAGPEEPKLLAGFIAAAGVEAVKANYDPAELLMGGFDPVAGVAALAPHIAHTRARDAARRDDGRCDQVPLGEGQVPFDEYIAALDEASYQGFYTIECEAGGDPVARAAAAARFLRRY